MSKTLLALLAAASIFAFGTVQAADAAAPMDKPAAMHKHHHKSKHHKKAMHHHHHHHKSMKSAVGAEPSDAVKP